MLYSNKDYSLPKKLAITAILLAMAIIINYFKATIPIAGAPVMRVYFGGPFLAFVGILFGPIYGGIAPLLSDIIGFLLNPTGAYIWPLSLVAFLKGFSIAFLWHSVKKIDFKIYNPAYLAVFSGILAFGVANLICINFFPETGYTQFLVGIGKKTTWISHGLIIAGAIGLCIHIIAQTILKNNQDKQIFERYLKLIICIGVPSLIFTTINTFILIEFLSLKTAFIYFWIPRVIEEITTILVSTYVIMVIINLYEKVFKEKLSNA